MNGPAISLAIAVSTVFVLVAGEKSSAIRTNLFIKGNSPVIVELYTSQGCTSCPPADMLLTELARLDPNIIPLSFHVDYWNSLGWADPYSSPQHTLRQKAYAWQWAMEEIPTPQLIINGQYNVAGSDRAEAESIVKRALQKSNGLVLKVDDFRSSVDSAFFTCVLETDNKKTNLVAVLVQKNTTDTIKGGENRGTILSHINIVRSLKEQPAAQQNEFAFPIPPDIKKENWMIVVFARQKDLKIIGATVYDPF